MFRLITVALFATVLGIGSGFAQGSCASQAMSKDGKPLSGAAKTSAIKKCCEQAAVSADGKPLKGAAKKSSVDKCMKDSSS
jgi:hypothetical protein